MDWNELFLNILYICLTCIIPLLVKYIIAYLTSRAREFSETLDNTILREYVNDATNIIGKIVLEVSQTYVDALKKVGQFNAESQKIAKDMAVNKAKELITEESKNAIIRLYGDFEAWINTSIEAMVKENKIHENAQ